MQSAARGRPPRRTHWPPQRPSRQRGARSSRAPGPQSTDTEGPGGWASRASQLRLAGGLRRHCEVPATGAPQPRSLPTLPGLGRAGKSSPCPRGTAKGCPRALCPAGRGVAPVPARHLSRAGPAPSLPPPPSSVRIAHPGTRLSAPNVLMGGSPPPPSFPSRSSCPRRPGGPWRAPEPSRWPRSGMPARGGHPARSARRLPASSRRSGMRGLTPIPPAPRISPAPYWGRSAPPGRGKTWSPARPPPPPPRSPPSPRRRYNPIPRRG